MTQIDYATAAWNPLIGCSPVSEECRNCWSAKTANRLKGNPHPKVGPLYLGTVKKTKKGRPMFTGRLRVVRERLEQPMKWKKARKMFVCSQSDLFHEAVPDALIEEIWDIMAENDQHTYLVLTKRANRMADMSHRLPFLEHVWLGTTVGLQKHDWRIHELLEARAAVRWLSLEPLLGPIQLTRLDDPLTGPGTGQPAAPPTWKRLNALTGWNGTIDWHGKGAGHTKAKIDWVVIGSESGTRKRRRHTDILWVKELLLECESAGVPVFLKQLHDNEGQKMTSFQGQPLPWVAYPEVG